MAPLAYVTLVPARLIEGPSGYTTTGQNGRATLRFMSPERLMEDKPSNPNADIWAF
ncbi:hypothetical protein FRC03_005148 [Tulasnella sp. 419]|nr:hypothetical protein FRC03_005148 [Tulasnella sp. 419]